MIEINATFFAQILNFLILVAILRALAYKPIYKILKQRADKIQDSIEKANSDRKAAELSLAQYNAKLIDANKQAQLIIDQANLAARQIHDAAIADTKRDVERLKLNAQADIQLQRNRAFDQMKDQILSLSLLAAEKVLAKNISSKDNDKLINDFIDNLNPSIFEKG